MLATKTGFRQTIHKIVVELANDGGATEHFSDPDISPVASDPIEGYMPSAVDYAAGASKRPGTLRPRPSVRLGLAEIPEIPY